MSTDAEWELWGQQDPYFGVITDDKYRKHSLDENSRNAFFESGRSHVQYVWSTCQRFLDTAFAPESVLDFGCGVGRLLIPFAFRAERVVGVDVSDSMLAEADRNCKIHRVSNVKLAKSDDELAALSGTYELVHSAIVLQHIEPERGLKLFSRLLDLVSPGGIGAIHVTYAKAIHARSGGVPPPVLPKINQEPAAAAAKRSTSPQRASFFRISAFPSMTVSVAPATVDPQSTPTGRDPEMQMNSYNINKVLFLLQQSGVKRFITDFTDHGGELGVFFFFQRPIDLESRRTQSLQE